MLTAIESQITKRFVAGYLEEDDHKVCFYTRLPTYKVYHGLFKLLEPLMKTNCNKSCPSLFDEFLMVLMKLCLGTPNEDLGYRFDIDSSRVSHTFHKWIHVMSVELKCVIAWPDPENLRQNLPQCFQKHFTNTKCIVDCFEIFIERPVAFEARAAKYSNYKIHNTVKFFGCYANWINFLCITSLGSKSVVQKDHSEVWVGSVRTN